MRIANRGRFSALLLLLSLAMALVAPTGAVAADDPSQGDVTQFDVGPDHHQHHGPGGQVDAEVCSHSVPAGKARCSARARIDAAAKHARPTPAGVPVKSGSLGNSGAYDPSYLQSAYNLTSAERAQAGKGKWVAVVDAYDSPTAQTDLLTYRSYFGLPNVQFMKVNQNGTQGIYPAFDAGWQQEISLDLDMVSATCAYCNVMLVEANSASFDDLTAAVNTAVRLGAVAVSNSYGADEFSFQSQYDAGYHHPGVAVTASSGDSGYSVQYPASSPYVIGVGGTSLIQNSNTGTRNGSETVWSQTGSGCSAYVSKPAWQHDTGCSNRTVTDVSAVADPSTGVWVIISGGWYIFGGTSAAAPIIASVYAMAGNPGGSPNPNSFTYGQTSGLNDITSGSNGSCGSYLCNGAPGYDGPTGNGTPNGITAFAGPAAQTAPAVTSLSPTSGPAAGGTSVTITGTGFTGASAVKFGSTAAASFTVNSATQIAATSPAGSGTVDVTVTTASGTSATSLADQFTYTGSAPAVSGVSPSSGPAAGGTSVTISGSNFSGASAVKFGGNAAASFTVNSATQIAATSPSGSGTVDVTVTTPAGTSAASSSDQFTYNATAQAPAVSGINPSSGPAGGGTSVTISGSNFSGVTAVKFGGNAAASYTVNSASQITATSPAGSGTVDVTVTTGAGTSATSSSDRFTYNAAAQPPAVSGISPSSGSTSGGTSVTISGSNFSGASAVKFGGNAAASFTVNSSTQITATSPAGSGTVDVTVTTAAGTSAVVSADRFTYAAPQPGFSMKIQPSSATLARGQSGQVTVQLTSTGGFNSPVSFFASGVPGSTIVTFNPAAVFWSGPSASATVSIITTPFSPVGTSTITVTGNAGGVSQNASFNLTIQ